MSDGVFVLGMHRSGTSVATRLVNLLGVPTCVEEDLLPVTDDNPSGYWESDPMTAFNDRIFSGSSPTGAALPPSRIPAGKKAPAVAALRSEARALFSQAFPVAPWVWKDRRNCLTLPFWLACLQVEPAVVLVHRSPLEIAASLEARDQPEGCIASRSGSGTCARAVAVVPGLPTLVSTYDEILDDPAAWCTAVRGFLGEVGIATEEPATRTLSTTLTRALQHVKLDREAVGGDPALSSEQHQLLAVVEGLRGAHHALSVPAVPHV